jgi:hypothetical protein
MIRRLIILLLIVGCDNPTPILMDGCKLGQFIKENKEAT